jgi:hypothetical protein
MTFFFLQKKRNIIFFIQFICTYKHTIYIHLNNINFYINTYKSIIIILKINNKF